MEVHIRISKKTSRKRKIHEKDNSPRDDYYFSFNEKDIDTPQGLTPYIMEEINGKQLGRIHIPGDGDYTDRKKVLQVQNGLTSGEMVGRKS